MSFLSPERLLLLVPVAALAALYVLLRRRGSHYAVRFTNLSLLEKVAPNRPGWRRHAPAAAFLVMLCLLVIGFAQPATSVRVPRERATIMLAVDTSLSMRATDVQPRRLAVAKQAALSFIEQTPDQFNLGLVSISGMASLVVPPTPDNAKVRSGIEGLSFGPRTAIGEAVFTSLQAISTFDTPRKAGPPPAHIVLLSDGGNTAGRSPKQAAQAAARAEVPVSTIAYGTPRGVVRLDGRAVPVPVDKQALRRLAGSTGGTFYEAATAEELSRVYENIGSSVGYRTERRDISAWFIGFGLLAALAAAAGSLRWFSRLP